jgi:serine/threonine-protein kinase
MNAALKSVPDWNALAPYLDRALDLPAGERDQWLAELTAKEPAIAEAVGKLLARHQRLDAQSFLAQPLIVSAQADRTGMRIGAYTIARLLGRGGMGEVWLASRTDGRFEGQCAIKFLDETATSPKLIGRFTREAQLLARLTHQNIARLLDAGATETGTPYFALEFVDGMRIDRYCDTHALGVPARVRLFTAVVAAVAHAHSQLIVHRDLKPSNVLVDAEGHVKLLDFGIAKLLSVESAEGLTRLEDIALTPEYAAPEQLLGETPSTATDVYQLGLLLYVLLARRLPHSMSGSRADKTRAALAEEVPMASTLASRAEAASLRGDLDAILAKALRKSPDERYPTAQAFQDELHRYLNREPVDARRGATWYRMHRFVTRHAVLLGAAVVVAAAVLIGATLAMREAAVARQEALKAQAVQSFITDVFLANRSDQPDPLKAQKTSARELLLIGAQRIKSTLADAPEPKAEVLQTLGLLMQDLDLVDEAVALQKDRVALLRQLGANTKLAEALLALADAMSTAAAINERDAVLGEAQRIIEADASASGAMRAELYFQLARVEQYRDWTKSAALADKSAHLFRRHGPATRLAEALRLEADAALERNDVAAAEQALLAGAGIARSLHHDRNRVLPGIELALAEVQAYALKPVAADQSYRRAVEEAARLYGREHSAYLDTLHGYGSFLVQHSRGAEALPLLREAVSTNRRINGPEEAYFGPNYESLLGVALVDHGLVEEAFPLFEHAIRTKRDAGRNNLSLAAFLHLAARAPQEAGDAVKALAYLDEARTIIDSHEAETKSDSGRDLLRANTVERARLSLRLNQPHESLRLLTLAGVDANSEPPDRRELMYHLMLAEAQVSNTEVQAAARSTLAIRTYIERLELQQPFAREMARLDMVDGMLELAAGDWDSASALFRRALQTRQRVLDAASPLIAESKLWLARTRRDIDARESAALLQDAKRILAMHSNVAPQYTRPTAPAFRASAN